MGAGGASLALLASLPQEERERTIRAETERYRLYGNLTAYVVRTACQRLSDDGYVLNEAVIIPDIAAVAVPVFSDEKLVAAVSVTNTISLLGPKRRAEIADTMAAAVQSVGFQTKKVE